MSKNSINSANSTNSSLFGAINSYLSQGKEIQRKLPSQELEKVIYRLEEAKWKRQRVFTCGNGGSAATANHFAADLHKTAMTPGKPPIDADSLCANSAELMAWANDTSYEDVFVGMMDGKIKEGDVLIGISGSGNSQNVLNAAHAAKAIKATTIGFTGFDGGKLKDVVDICIIVPSNNMRQIEDIHMSLCHLITDCLINMPAEEAKKSYVLSPRSKQTFLTQNLGFTDSGHRT